MSKLFAKVYGWSTEAQERSLDLAAYELEKTVKHRENNDTAETQLAYDRSQDYSGAILIRCSLSACTIHRLSMQ
jgi:hypothetical protein